MARGGLDELDAALGLLHNCPVCRGGGGETYEDLDDDGQPLGINRCTECQGTGQSTSCEDPACTGCHDSRRLQHQGTPCVNCSYVAAPAQRGATPQPATR